MELRRDVANVFAGLTFSLDRIHIYGSAMMLRETPLRDAEMEKLIANEIGDGAVWFEVRLVRPGNRNDVFMLVLGRGFWTWHG
jgi:hypothetical protein